MYQRRPSRGRKPPSRPSPVVAMLADQFAEKPWPLNRGEFLVAGPPVPQPPPAPSFTIPPPPWVTDPNFGGAVQAETKPVGNDALAKLRAAAGDDEWPQWDLGPPAVLEPLRYRIPEPSWREELAAAEARDERDRLANARALLAEHEEPRRPDYPAKRSLVQPVPEPEPGQPRPQIPAPPWKDTA